MFYIPINLTSDEKVVGKAYPQIQEMISKSYKDSEHSIYNMPYKEFPSFIPNLEGLKIHENAILTDFISSVHITNEGFIVSKNVINTLKNFKLPQHQYYPTSIHQGKRKKFDTHYWFHYLYDLSDKLFDESWGNNEYIKSLNLPWDYISHLITLKKVHEVTDIFIYCYEKMHAQYISIDLTKELDEKGFTGYKLGSNTVPLIQVE